MKLIQLLAVLLTILMSNVIFTQTCLDNIYIVTGTEGIDGTGNQLNPIHVSNNPAVTSIHPQVDLNWELISAPNNFLYENDLPYHPYAYDPVGSYGFWNSYSLIEAQMPYGVLNPLNLRILTAYDPYSQDTSPGPGDYFQGQIGDYIFETHFCLDADVTAVEMNVQCLADNHATIYLNGFEIGQHTTLTAGHQIILAISTIDINKFNIGGDNTIQVKLTNTSTVSGFIFATDITTSNNTLEACCSNFSPIPNNRYWLSAWVREDVITQVKNYENSLIELEFFGTYPNVFQFSPSGEIIDGWQRIVGDFTVPAGSTNMDINLVNNNTSIDCYFDDIRIHPFNSSMKSYVYDPETLRLMAELDDNNYATFYEYDNEGQLIRIKKETERGIMTIQESRSTNPITAE